MGNHNHPIINAYELQTPNQSIAIGRTLSRQTWAKALELALLYGWQPKGTEPPDLDFFQLNAEWDGRYYTNDGQAVKREDAFLLAAALEKALKDIPNENPKIYWNSQFWLDDGLPEELTPEERAFVEDGMDCLILWENTRLSILRAMKKAA